MRLVTWNLRHGAGRPVWPDLQAALRADVVFLQEADESPRGTGVAWAQVPGARWGSAVVTTLGAIRPIVVPGYAGWVVGGVVEAAGGPLAVFSLHAPSGTRDAARGPYAAEVAAIIGLLAAAVPPDTDLVIGGDFNLTLGERRPGESLQTTAGERAALRAIAAAGLVSCWTAAHPDAPLPQTLRWAGDRSPGKTTPYHCDGILVPRAWSPWVTCTVHTDECYRVSDHNPVSATVTVPEASAPD